MVLDHQKNNQVSVKIDERPMKARPADRPTSLQNHIDRTLPIHNLADLWNATEVCPGTEDANTWKLIRPQSLQTCSYFQGKK